MRELGDVDWENLTTGQSASENGKPLRTKCVECRVCTFQCVKTRSIKRPGWLSGEIRNAGKEKQKAFVRFKITGLELDLYHYRSKQRQVKKITASQKRV